MASNVLSKRPLPSSSAPSSSSASWVDDQAMDCGGSSYKKSKIDDDASFDGMDDATLLDALEEEEQMMADMGRPRPQATPTLDPRYNPGNPPRRDSPQAAPPVPTPAVRSKHDSSNPFRLEWTRPPPPPIDPMTDTVSFQQIDIDHYVAPPIPGMPGLQSGAVPVLRMYGVTMDGNSVCAHLHGFLPYFYANLPREDFAAEHCSDFRTSLNGAVLGDMRSNRDGITAAVVSVEICQR